jgi:hypothetical protein
LDVQYSQFNSLVSKALIVTGQLTKINRGLLFRVNEAVRFLESLQISLYSS